MKRLKDRLPKQLANDAVLHFRKSFQVGGFEDRILEKWELPQRMQKNEKGTRYLYSGHAHWDKKKKYKGFTRADRTRAVLVKTGNLRTSVRVLRTSPGEAIIGSSLPYAQVHNDGGKMKNGKKMPQRQFVGDSKVLTAGMKKKISGEILKALKI